MARIGDSAICCALCTSRALRRASPKRAPPNSWSAQTAASRPSPTASGAKTGAGTARRVCHAGSNAYIYTALRVSGAACVRSWRPRPQVSPTRTQFAARTLAPVCSVSSRTSPAARGDSHTDPRSRRRPPGRPGPARARPGCDTRCRGAPAAGTVPAPGAGARAGPHRPTRPRRRGTAAAAHSPQTRRRPASHAPNPPDTAVAGRRTDRPRAGARTPSACSRPAAARRFPPAPGVRPTTLPTVSGTSTGGASGCGSTRARPHHREHLDPQAARRDLPPPSRTTLGSSSRAATGPPGGGNRTLHRCGRRPARGCRHPAKPPRPARRAGGRGCPVEYVRPDSESPCRPP